MPLVATVRASAGPWLASRSRPKGPRAGHGPRGTDRHHQRSARRPGRALARLAKLSLQRHDIRAAESPVPVRRLVTPRRLVGPFGRSNGPSDGQRVVPMPVRLTRRLSLAWSAGKPSRGRRVKRYETCGVRARCSIYRIVTSASHARVLFHHRRRSCDPHGHGCRHQLITLECWL